VETPPLAGPRRAAEASEGEALSRLLLFLGVTALCALCVVASVALVDRPVASWVHEHLASGSGWFTTTYLGPPMKFGPFSLMAGPAVALGPLTASVFAVLAIGAYFGFRLGPRTCVILALCLSVFAANELTSFLKGLFGRTWPESWLESNPSWIRDGAFGFSPFHGGPAWASFPSGHTAIIGAAATVLWTVYPRLKVVWAALVAVVAAGLIGGNYHFVSDVIAGLYLGVGIGVGVTRLILPSKDSYG
jgi:membrane-associated phospholipid phosphatase